MDYWDIERTGKVDVNHQGVVNREFNGQTLLPGESIVRDGDRIILVNGVFRNVGRYPNRWLGPRHKLLLRY